MQAPVQRLFEVARFHTPSRLSETVVVPQVQLHPSRSIEEIWMSWGGNVNEWEADYEFPHSRLHHHLLLDL